MKTVRFCFTVFLVVAIGGRVASCVDIVWARKCCPVDRLYDPETRFCVPAGADGVENQQRMLDRLRSGFRVATSAVLESPMYNPPYCNFRNVLVDVPAVEVLGLMEAHPSPDQLPPGFCFDLTPSDELVARTCRPRDQYCGRPGYTCVKKCCYLGDIMFVADSKYSTKVTCIESDIPFTLSAYETDASGSPVGRSNNTVLPYFGRPLCDDIQIMKNRFTLTKDGNLLLNENVIKDTEYCLENYAKREPWEFADLRAVLCYSNSKPPVSFHFWLIILSVVCLVLALIVYVTLPYLRNTHGYYVMFYMVCQLVYFVCTMIDELQLYDITSPSQCIPFGYFALFATLTTCCWLNVICFDIYWMLRYNNSINRNTSKSVRTIMYHIYCWGFSSICVSTGYLFQHSQNKTLLELAPDIGEYQCFFFERYHYGTLIFYLLPTCGMFTVNLIFFLLTAIHCSRIKSELNKFKQTDSKIEMFLFYKEKFVMSIKLFLIFGLPILFWMLSELFEIKGIIKEIFKVTKNLQGAFIFIIFLAKRKVIMDLWKKSRRSMAHSVDTNLTNLTSGSS